MKKLEIDRKKRLPKKIKFNVMQSDDSDGLFTPSNMTIHVEERQNSFKKMFSNYVGMGLDARVVYTV